MDLKVEFDAIGNPTKNKGRLVALVSRVDFVP
jgi:hypothetical protein